MAAQRIVESGAAPEGTSLARRLRSSVLLVLLVAVLGVVAAALIGVVVVGLASVIDHALEG